jgi:protein-disulfide isomerase
MDYHGKPMLIVALLAIGAAAILITVSYVSSQSPLIIQPDYTQLGSGIESTPVETEDEAPPSPLPTVESPSSKAETISFEQPTKGDPNAPVTIIEFAEFYCPFCARYVWQTFPVLEREYIDTGLVRYEFRNLVVHGEISNIVASAGECAHTQGRFWAFHDRLFEIIFSNRNLSQYNQLDIEALKATALEVGMALDPFTSCMSSTEVVEKIAADKDELYRLINQLPPEEAAAAQRIGTPSFFINGHILVGAQPYEKFKQLIDELIEGS